MTDIEAQRNLQPELGRSERLLWAGRPGQGILFRPSDIFLIPFSLMWGGFAIFWETAVITMGAPFFFMLWGIPFVLVGLHLIFGRFIFDAWARSRTWCGVSNERILIRAGGISSRLTTLNLASLSEVSMTEKSDGRGTLTLGPAAPAGFNIQKRGWPGAGSNQSPSFEAIGNARQVLDVIRDAQKRLSD